MSKKTSIYIRIISGTLFVITLAVFFILKGGDSSSNFLASLIIDQKDALKETKTERTETDSNLSDLPLEYKNESLGFSFRYPKGFKITEFSDGQGNVILAEGENGKSFQIYIQPFDEPAFVETSTGKEMTLTPERIRQDVPKIVMRNTQLYELDGISTIVFESEEPNFGPTFEVWFIYPENPYPHGNYLYQITSSADFAQEVTEIINTWRFHQ